MYVHNVTYSTVHSNSMYTQTLPNFGTIFEITLSKKCVWGEYSIPYNITYLKVYGKLLFNCCLYYIRFYPISLQFLRKHIDCSYIQL